MKNGLVKNLVKKTGLALAGLATAGTLMLGSGCSLRQIVLADELWNYKVQEDRYQELQKEKYREELPEKNKHFFACNYAMGDWKYPRDFDGRKDVFKKDEHIILINFNPDAHIGDVEREEVYGGTDKKLLLKGEDSKLTWEGEPSGLEIDSESMIEKGEGCKNYKALFYDNNQVVGELYFKIIP